MFDQEELERIRQQEKQFREKVSKSPQRRSAFTTVSGNPVETVYTPCHLDGFDYLRDLGFPGEYPFVRGVHNSGYRGRLWTMRMF